MMLVARLIESNLIDHNTHIILISSLCIHTSYPNSAIYAASKYGLSSFARSLGQEYKVLNFIPGPINTEQAIENSPNKGKTRNNWIEPSAYAKQIRQLDLSGKQGDYVPTWKNYFISIVASLFPISISKFMNKIMTKKEM